MACNISNRKEKIINVASVSSENLIKMLKDCKKKKIALIKTELQKRGINVE